jgi:hypothetical protein
VNRKPLEEGQTLVTGRTARGTVQFITNADFTGVRVGDQFTMDVDGKTTKFRLVEMEWDYHGQRVIRGIK